MTAEIAADRLRGQGRKFTAFQWNMMMVGHDDGLESSRGFKGFKRPLWKERNVKCILIRFPANIITTLYYNYHYC